MDTAPAMVGFMGGVASCAGSVIALLATIKPNAARVDVWLHVEQPTQIKARSNRGARVKVSHGLKRAK